MAHYYFDSSALVKCYVVETGTGWVTTQCAPEAGHAIDLVRITGAEMIAAFFRRVQAGSLALADHNPPPHNSGMNYVAAMKLLKSPRRWLTRPCGWPKPMLCGVTMPCS